MFSTAYAGGATDKSVYVRGFTISTGEIYTAGAYNTSGITAKYRRAGANAEATITLATQTVSGAHSDGGFVHVSGGVYRLDLPDAAIATGSDYVDIWVYGISDVVFTPAHIDILGADPRGDSVSVDAASVRTAVGLTSANLETLITTVDTVVDRIEVDTQDLQARTPAALVGGRMDASVGAMAANVLTASALATDAVTEIQSGLALSTQVDALETAATNIEADTQDIQSRLPAALVSGRMASDAQAIAGVILAEGGSAPASPIGEAP